MKPARAPRRSRLAGRSLASAALHAPHEHIVTGGERERFLVSLFDALWTRYRAFHPFVQVYERVVREHGARFRNDHIAFRTLATQTPHAGLASVTRPFEALGYRAVGHYRFPDKHLASVHLEHDNALLPKLFVSELQTWKLGARVRRIIERCVASQRAPLSAGALATLASLDETSEVHFAGERAKLLAKVTRHFLSLPWDVPEKRDLLAVDEESQFGAWVLVNGYDVNHFTALVDSHGVDALRDVERTAAALRAAGVPMKAEIEGEPGSPLRQTSTHAVMRDVRVKDSGRVTKLPWSWAYFEIAERPLLRDPTSGAVSRFEGFLGAQATNLFEMTKVAR